MTIWAIFSDVHGRVDRLARVLGDSSSQGVKEYLCLGDVGGERALEMLVDLSAVCVFGNWEASGLRGLPGPLRRIVGHWQPSFRTENFWAAHASPVWPAGLEIAGVVEHLRGHGLHWSALFPSLLHSDPARSAALAEMESCNIPVFFHGHTHVQDTWQLNGGASPARAPDREFSISTDVRYLVGVGSVGLPRDGSRSGYVLFDTETGQIGLRQV